MKKALLVRIKDKTTQVRNLKVDLQQSEIELDQLMSELATLSVVEAAAADVHSDGKLRQLKSKKNTTTAADDDFFS